MVLGLCPPLVFAYYFLRWIASCIVYYIWNEGEPRGRRGQLDLEIPSPSPPPSPLPYEGFGVWPFTHRYDILRFTRTWHWYMVLLPSLPPELLWTLVLLVLLVLLVVFLLVLQRQQL